MDKSYIGLIGAIIGTILGFLLSEWRLCRTERRQCKNARILLKLEINQNLKLLSEYWEKLNQIEPELNDMYNEIIIARLTELNLPEWNNIVWKNQMLLFALAMKPNKLKQIYEFYSRLDRIRSIYNSLSALAETNKENITNFEISQVPVAVVFKIPVLPWTEFKELVCKVIAEGSPLEK